MRLTVDVSPVLLRSAGVKNHLFYWTRALVEQRNGNSVEMFPFVRELGELHHERGLESGLPDWRLFLLVGLNWPPTSGLVSRLLPAAELYHGSPLIWVFLWCWL